MAPDEAPRVAKLTQDRAHRTRRSLVEAASALWSERGYDAVAASDICERAGVSKGTFFYYFPTKEHLLLELVAAGGGDRLGTAIDERLAVGAPLLDVLQTAVSVIADGQRYAPRELVGRAALEVLRGARRARPDDTARPEPREIYARAYAAAIARGELPATFQPGELGAITNWVLLQGTLFWAVGAVGPLTLEQVLWRRVQLVVHGAAAPSLQPWPLTADPTLSGPAS